MENDNKACTEVQKSESQIDRLRQKAYNLKESIIQRNIRLGKLHCNFFRDSLKDTEKCDGECDNKPVNKVEEISQILEECFDVLSAPDSLISDFENALN